MHNDFRRERGIFPLFDGLAVPNLDTPLNVNPEVVELYNKVYNASSPTNGSQTPPKTEANGVSH